MPQYHSLNISLDWKELIPKIEPNVISLFLRDNNNFMVAWGVKSTLDLDSFSFSQFQDYLNVNKSNYIFGYLGYDIKNAIEPTLESNNTDFCKTPNHFFFVPENVLIQSNGTSTYYGDMNTREVDRIISKTVAKTNNKTEPIILSPEISKTSYLNKVNHIKSLLQQGDIYEINFCQNFSGKFNEISAFRTFKELVKYTDAPFSTYFTFNDFAILSASPERFLKKKKNKILSQPIKGTAPRSNSRNKDLKIQTELQNSEKEISENVMIVDLVRNDLSKIANKDSVKVDSLTELHSFKSVHQLISTISCKIAHDVSESDIIKSLFPMGSMTGAPKYKAMQIAENLEDFKRGLYAGTIGYFAPNGDFDFNVVIRTLMINLKEKTINASVGGAITIKSDAETEYAECLVKLEALKKALC